MTQMMYSALNCTGIATGGPTTSGFCGNNFQYCKDHCDIGPIVYDAGKPHDGPLYASDGKLHIKMNWAYFQIKSYEVN
jgi:hypothetical protein